MKPELEMHFQIHTDGQIVHAGPDEDGLGLIRIHYQDQFLYLDKHTVRLLIIALTQLCEEN